MSAKVVIVGAGYCGVSAAMAAREAGFDGPITLIGDDPEWPYERPSLSKWGEAGPALRPIVPTKIYGEKNIDLRRGERVTRIARSDRCLHLASGETVDYTHLLLATGADARRLEQVAWPSANPLYLRSLADAKALSDQIAAGADVLIIGGGFIGLELAASLTTRKAFVHVVEAQDRILARTVPPEIAQKVHDLHAAHGVAIHVNTTTTSIKNGLAILSDGQRVRADHLIVGAGSIPNTELAKTADLKVDDGIVVDERFSTSDPDIFAAGDCCTGPMGHEERMRLESWQVAGDQGRRAGQIMADAKPESVQPPWFWSDQFEHSLQVVGVPALSATHALRQLPEGGLLSVGLTKDHQITFAAGFAPGSAIGRDIKLVQKLIDSGIAIAPGEIVDPGVSLKSILKGGAA